MVATLQVEESGRFYIVAIYDDSGDTVEEYKAGNSVYDSQGYDEPGMPGAYNFGTMVRLGRVTQAEMAQEHDAALNTTYEIVDVDGEILSYEEA